MKYDREICIINFKSIMVIHTKEKKIKVFPIGRRQKQTFLSEINLCVKIQDGPPNIDILVSYIFDFLNTHHHLKSLIFNPP